jgi:heme-degrading monooxygenase HmoA
VVTIGMNYSVIDGKQDAFVSMCMKVIELMTQISGHRESRLFADVSDPCRFLIVSEWDDETAFRAFVASDRFARVVDWGKTSILADRPRHRVYQESDEIGRQSK